MRKFPFLRRPVRLILYAVLLAMVTTAALIFAWQYQLDGVILDHAIDSYAYVGTVVRADGEIIDCDIDPDLAEEYGIVPAVGGSAFIEEIPDELVQWLYDNEYVARIDNRRTLAGLVGEYHRTKANTTGQTQKAGDYSSETQYWFLEGTVADATNYHTNEIDGTANDVCRVTVDKMWNAPETPTQQMVVEIWRCVDEVALEVGQRVFLVMPYYYNNSGEPETGKAYVDTGAYLQNQFGEDLPLSLPQQYPYVIIPEGVDSEQFIQAHLESTGLDKLLDRQLKTLYTVTLRQTQDMMMIPLFTQGKAKAYEGRVLTPADMGERVCVIPFSLSQRNRLSVGDTILLSAAEGCYPLVSTTFGKETGDPGVDEEMLEYGAYEEYEIVGIYAQKGSPNYLYFGTADIFVPAREHTAAETVRPYAFSFRVPGPDWLDFEAQFQPVLEEYGYSMVVEDTGWDDVKENFYSMQARRQLMLLCALVAFGVAVVVSALLLNAHCRYEYGLRRLVGASKGEAVGIYCSTFLFTAIPGAAAAVWAAWYGAICLIKGALEADVQSLVPTDVQCAQTLAAWAMAELVVMLVLLLVLAMRNERRGLLRLVRR